MNLLEYLLDLYESSEEITAEEVFLRARQENPDLGKLSKEKLVELKRLFLQIIEDKSRQCFDDVPLFDACASSREQNGNQVKERYESGFARRKRKRPHRKYIEAFVNNIAAPKSLEEMQEFFLDGNDAQQLVIDTENTAETIWTSPKWAKRGDIVLFMHSKTSKSSLTRIRTEVRKRFAPDSEEAKRLEKAISEQLEFYKKYGGKIFVIGRINGKPEEAVVDPLLHYSSRVFCEIDDLFLLEKPIDISEFNGFLKISGLSAITPAYGNIYEQLKEIIISKNNVPEYFFRSLSTPFPHSLVNRENWMELGLEYRYSFVREDQFRQCYVNYLLRAVGDYKTIYMECACYKGDNHATFVDNVICIGRQYLPVEVKLNIGQESDLESQCEQYCELDRLVLDKKSHREAKIEDVVRGKVLIVDTFAVYVFSMSGKEIRVLYDLSEIQSLENVLELREVIIDQVLSINA